MDEATSTRLDEAFRKLLFRVGQLLARQPKNVQIRISRWVERLSEPVLMVPWKRNRNNYAKLLLWQLERNRLETPFNEIPKFDGELPTLPKHLLADIRRARDMSRHGGSRDTAAQRISAPPRVLTSSLATLQVGQQRKADEAADLRRMLSEEREKTARLEAEVSSLRELLSQRQTDDGEENERLFDFLDRLE